MREYLRPVFLIPFLLFYALALGCSQSDESALATESEANQTEMLPATEVPVKVTMTPGPTKQQMATSNATVKPAEQERGIQSPIATNTVVAVVTKKSTDTATVVPTPTIQPTQISSATPSPTPQPTSVPTSEPTPTPEPTATVEPKTTGCDPSEKSDQPLGVPTGLGGLTVYAGSSEPGFGGDCGPAYAAQLYNPTGLAIDEVGNLYISTDQRIRKVDRVTGIISTIAGTGRTGFGGDNGPALEAKFNSPLGLAVDSRGNIYVVDSGNGRIRRVDGATGVINTVAGGGVPKIVGGMVDPRDGGSATEVWLKNPTAVLVDAEDNFYFQSDGRIRKVEVSTGIIGTVVGTGLKGVEGDGGQGVDAKLAKPMGIALDRSGNLFIADTNNHRVRLLDAATGIINTIAGVGEVGPVPSDPLDFDIDELSKQGAGFSGDGGVGTEAMLALPHGVGIDAAGDVLILDTLNARIRKVVLGSGIISTFLDGGKVIGARLQSAVGTGGRSISYTHFDPPTAMAVNKDGVVYIADVRSNRVLRFQP